MNKPSEKKSKYHPADIRNYRLLQVGALMLVVYLMGAQYYSIPTMPTPESAQPSTEIALLQGATVTPYTPDTFAAPQQGKAVCGTQIRYHRSLILGDTPLEDTTHGEKLTHTLGGTEQNAAPGVIEALALTKEGTGWKLTTTASQIAPYKDDFGISPPAYDVLNRAAPQQDTTLSLWDVEPVSGAAPITALAPRAFVTKQGKGTAFTCASHAFVTYSLFDANGTLVDIAATPIRMALADTTLPPIFRYALYGAHDGAELFVVAPPGWLAGEAAPWNNYPQDKVLLMELKIAP